MRDSQWEEVYCGHERDARASEGNSESVFWLFFFSRVANALLGLRSKWVLVANEHQMEHLLLWCFIHFFEILDILN